MHQRGESDESFHPRSLISVFEIAKWVSAVFFWPFQGGISVALRFRSGFVGVVL